MLHQRRFSLPVLALLMLGLTACESTINTLPSYPHERDAPTEIVLEVPPGLQIKSVDFDAAMFADSNDVGGRGFVKVYAEHEETGEQYLLLYESITERARPIQVIRFQAAR